MTSLDVSIQIAAFKFPEYRTCDPLTEFTCDNQQCISMRQRCDLQPDCVDGSDERLCGEC